MHDRMRRPGNNGPRRFPLSIKGVFLLTIERGEGERKLVARALLHAPELLWLDFPSCPERDCAMIGLRMHAWGTHGQDSPIARSTAAFAELPAGRRDLTVLGNGTWWVCGVDIPEDAIYTLGQYRTKRTKQDNANMETQ